MKHLAYALTLLALTGAGSAANCAIPKSFSCSIQKSDGGTQFSSLPGVVLDLSQVKNEGDGDTRIIANLDGVQVALSIYLSDKASEELSLQLLDPQNAKVAVLAEALQNKKSPSKLIYRAVQGKDILVTVCTPGK